MKKAIAFLLSVALMLVGCSSSDQTSASEVVSSSPGSTFQQSTVTETPVIPEDEEGDPTPYHFEVNYASMNDADCMRYVEDTLYMGLVDKLATTNYFVENVSTAYISQEYIDELQYNSKANIFYGYTLAELDNAFQGTRYVFTLGDNGETVVKEFEEYDNAYEKMIQNVAIGTGVILVCVTVSAVSAGAGVPAVSMIFAASAKTGTTFALSSGAFSGIAAAITTGIQTHDMNEVLKEASLAASEGFKWGAISGAIAGGAKEAVALHGATLNGLTMNEAAIIQKETNFPLDVIKQFNNMEQFDICKEAGLKAEMVNGKIALIRNIDLNFVDEASGLTNLERMQQGFAALDPSGIPYELHHIGQRPDSTLAILTQKEHRLGDSYKIWHKLDGKSNIDRKEFDDIREEFWENLAKIMG